MTTPDTLTHAERVRLEALAQTVAIAASGQLNKAFLATAAEYEQFILIGFRDPTNG